MLHRYLNLAKHKPKTDKRLVSNANLLFLKAFNYTLTVALLCQLSPSARWVRSMHHVGIACIIVLFALNTSLVAVLSHKRPSTCFTPLTIVATSFSTPCIIAIDILTLLCTPRQAAMIVSAAAPPYVFVRWLADGAVHRWFEDAVIVDVWLFFFFFCFRKQGWFRQNLAEKDGIVRFFKTTCWRRIEAAPTAELLYSATTGLANVLALQLGKVVAVFAARRLGMQAEFQVAARCCPPLAACARERPPRPGRAGVVPEWRPRLISALYNDERHQRPGALLVQV